jgi:catechol 2,3-dioxygenase-like lactoylglutathione lyase family enzyme
VIEKITGVGITVSHIEQAIGFYTTVLGFEHIETVEDSGPNVDQLIGLRAARLQVATMHLGEQQIRLMEVVSHKGRPIPPDSRSNDLWFQHIAIVVRDIDATYDILRQHRVQHVSSMPQTLPEYIKAAAGVRAFYFRDPDGNNLELIWFPPGKSDPKWQSSTEDSGLFLGIDHTAIGVSSTPASLAFYRDKLGLAVAGQSENYGPEQEHLNMVFGAHLEITGLTAPDGEIGVEFLDYLSPPGGRPFPADTTIADLWHWETVATTRDLDALVAAVPEAVVSPIVQIGAATRTVYLRDPDGHALRIIEVTS